MARTRKYTPEDSMVEKLLNYHRPKVPRPHLAQEMRERGAVAPEEHVRGLMPWAAASALGLSIEKIRADGLLT